MHDDNDDRTPLAEWREPVYLADGSHIGDVVLPIYVVAETETPEGRVVTIGVGEPA